MKISLFSAFLLLLSSIVTHAGSATWNLNPTSSDWNTAANWTPATVPNGSSNIATFDVSNTTDLSLSAAVTVNSIAFNPSASNFTITTDLHDLTISGAGIVNNSIGVQQFVIPTDPSGAQGTMEFFNSASAGSNTLYTIQGSTTGSGTIGGLINFWDSSTAGDASFTLEGGSTGARTVGGRVVFNGTSTAATADFDIHGGEDANFGATLAYVGFYDNSSAGSATIIAEGDPDPLGNGEPGIVTFHDQSTAASATLIANKGPGSSGGNITFADSATGDNAKVIMRGNSNMFFFLIDGPSLTIGSLEGEGTVECEEKNLIVGQNNTDTTFAGSIFGTGSLTKIGSGTLVLAKPSFYSGGTIIQRGRLLVNNHSGSATGPGPVQVNRAGFGGNGIAAGAVTIGDGSGAGATLSPGIDGAGLLTIQSSLTFKVNSRYNWNVEATAVKADETVAQGVTIEIGALFQIFGRGSVPLPIGTAFTAISNTAATPIAGTFANLADGSTIVIGSNTFQANYEGGDGNDLTLTVVP